MPLGTYILILLAVIAAAGLTVWIATQFAGLAGLGAGALIAILLALTLALRLGLQRPPRK